MSVVYLQAQLAEEGEAVVHVVLRAEGAGRDHALGGGREGRERSGEPGFVVGRRVRPGHTRREIEPEAIDRPHRDERAQAHGGVPALGRIARRERRALEDPGAGGRRFRGRPCHRDIRPERHAARDVPDDAERTRIPHRHADIAGLLRRRRPRRHRRHHRQQDPHQCSCTHRTTLPGRPPRAGRLRARIRQLTIPACTMSTMWRFGGPSCSAGPSSPV